MAEMIPEKLPSKASKGEQRVFSILQNLPNDYLIYYEPVIENRYPDFILICPDMGVMIIEVKGWYPNNIIGGDSNSIRVNMKGAVRNEKHPLRQASDYKYRLMDVCSRNEAFKSLTNKTGHFQNRFFFPFSHFVILSNITKDQISNHNITNFYDVFPENKVATSEDIVVWESMDGFQIRNEIKKYFDPYWNFPKMTMEQVDILRAIIHPEIIISSRIQHINVIELKKDSTIKVLDYKQERNAKKIGKGHRILFGVAGSGKTVLLISRARFLSQEKPEHEILVLCYNKALAYYLKNCLLECKNVYVYHFHEWGKANKVIQSKKDSPKEYGKKVYNSLNFGNRDSKRFDAVLIDEAQDFEPYWFRCVLLAMKDPIDGDLLIVADGNQGLYGRNTRFTWSELGVKAVGRTISSRFDLDKNYRNTKALMEISKYFASSSSIYEEDGILCVGINPQKCVRKTNYKPLIYSVKNQNGQREYGVLLKENNLIIKIIEQLINKNNYTENDICILYPYLSNKQTYIRAFTSLREQLNEKYNVIWVNHPSINNSHELVTENGLKIQTIHSSKGLQYKVVILMWADLLPRFDHIQGTEEFENDKRLFFVAITRAEDNIIITHTKTTEFINKIINSPIVKLNEY